MTGDPLELTMDEDPPLSFIRTSALDSPGTPGAESDWGSFSLSVDDDSLFDSDADMDIVSRDLIPSIELRSDSASASHDRENLWDAREAAALRAQMRWQAKQELLQPQMPAVEVTRGTQHHTTHAGNNVPRDLDSLRSHPTAFEETSGAFSGMSPRSAASGMSYTCGNHATTHRNFQAESSPGSTKHVAPAVQGNPEEEEEESPVTPCDSEGTPESVVPRKRRREKQPALGSSSNEIDKEISSRPPKRTRNTAIDTPVSRHKRAVYAFGVALPAFLRENEAYEYQIPDFLLPPKPAVVVPAPTPPAVRPKVRVPVPAAVAVVPRREIQTSELLLRPFVFMTPLDPPSAQRHIQRREEKREQRSAAADRGLDSSSRGEKPAAQPKSAQAAPQPPGILEKNTDPPPAPTYPFIRWTAQQLEDLILPLASRKRQRTEHETQKTFAPMPSTHTVIRHHLPLLPAGQHPPRILTPIPPYLRRGNPFGVPLPTFLLVDRDFREFRIPDFLGAITDEDPQLSPAPALFTRLENPIYLPLLPPSPTLALPKSAAYPMYLPLIPPSPHLGLLAPIPPYLRRSTAFGVALPTFLLVGHDVQEFRIPAFLDNTSADEHPEPASAHTPAPPTNARNQIYPPLQLPCPHPLLNSVPASLCRSTAFGVPLPTFLRIDTTADDNPEHEFCIPDFLSAIAAYENRGTVHMRTRRTDAFGVRLPEELLGIGEAPREFVLPTDFGLLGEGDFEDRLESESESELG